MVAAAFPNRPKLKRLLFRSLLQPGPLDDGTDYKRVLSFRRPKRVSGSLESGAWNSQTAHLLVSLTCSGQREVHLF